MEIVYDIASTIVGGDAFEGPNGWSKVHISRLSKRMIKKSVNNAIAAILSELKYTLSEIESYYE